MPTYSSYQPVNRSHQPKSQKLLVSDKQKRVEVVRGTCQTVSKPTSHHQCHCKSTQEQHMNEARLLQIPKHQLHISKAQNCRGILALPLNNTHQRLENIGEDRNGTSKPYQKCGLLQLSRSDKFVYKPRDKSQNTYTLDTSSPLVQIDTNTHTKSNQLIRHRSPREAYRLKQSHGPALLDKPPCRNVQSLAQENIQSAQTLFDPDAWKRFKMLSRMESNPSRTLSIVPITQPAFPANPSYLLPIESNNEKKTLEQHVGLLQDRDAFMSTTVHNLIYATGWEVEAARQRYIYLHSTARGIMGSLSKVQLEQCIK
ncbi:hypothetical protein MT418_005297 [Batrachochytrium dendrobatidis]